MKRIIIRSVILMIIIGLGAAVYVYIFVINKPHPDYENLDPEYILLASDLYESYQDNRNDAEEKFDGKVIQLNGTFDKIEQSDSLMVGIFVFDEGHFGDEGIRCTMLNDQQEKLNKEIAGSEVRVKGFVSGYNDTDIILEKCSIIN